MKGMIFFSFLIIIVIGVLVFFIFYELYPSEVQYFIDVNENKSIFNETRLDSYPQGIVFYENIRFPSSEISYSIEQECSGNFVNDSRAAFNTLEDLTVLSFNELPENGEIKVICSHIYDGPQEGYFVAGEGGPSALINTTKYHVIKNGTIFLYRNNNCQNPVVAIHEILHVLGFKHSSNKNSIMYTTSDCKQEITKDIKDKIDALYSDPSLSDLEIKKVSAEKQGKYLSFEAEVINVGLSISEDTNISVYIGDENFGDFSIGKIEIGAGKIMRVTNLAIPKSATEVTFIIDDSNFIHEIRENNNEKSLFITN